MFFLACRGNRCIERGLGRRHSHPRRRRLPPHYWPHVCLSRPATALKSTRIDLKDLRTGGLTAGGSQVATGWLGWERACGWGSCENRGGAVALGGPVVGEGWELVRTGSLGRQISEHPVISTLVAGTLLVHVFDTPISDTQTMMGLAS